ncbi:hypothetical protein L218DRAFT_882284 [Marasmius fiardii PR-910]|nr:hypothetical protein L218DRAFT_882284 [Marasmius fiardii PR-910]
MRFASLTTAVLLLVGLQEVKAGPIAYGICQTGCNIVAVACYAAAGATFGTVAAPAAPAAILGCNSALGSCSAACAATALIAPIP